VMTDTPSRELDAKIAAALGTAVYRCNWVSHPHAMTTSGAFMPACAVPHYTTDPDNTAPIAEMCRWIEARGMHYRLQSPFRPGQPYFAGATPHDFTGWNGRSDIECAGESLGHALGLLVLAVAEHEKSPAE